ncbi:MAG: HAD-IA family hydrolase [Deltaproteobacteria bacterium]|nr:HAD-IA family hydrolase [Deltaproteobacteria bacterium]
MKSPPFLIKAVLFDFDGTLTQPGALDFSTIKRAIGCPLDQAVLEFIETLETQGQRKKAMAMLKKFEIDAASNSEPNAGVEELISDLRAQDLCVGIISRNSFQSIERALENFEKVNISDFDLIISRDTPVKPKPSADGILLAAWEMNVDVKQMLVVGDFVFDMQAGRAAGAFTVFLDHQSISEHNRIESDFTISNLQELKKIVRMGQPLSGGKLPNEFLEEFLDHFDFNDPSILIRPGVGEDFAAVDVNNEEVLILKTDPITFTTDSMGSYAVLVNANDIATSGAVPRWFLTTLFFPRGITAFDIWQVMHELKTVCRKWNITLCGGHTEITDAVTRPVVTGLMAGTVSKKDLIDKRNIKCGDKILLTKGIAVEGTAIIAREFEDKLKHLGMSESEIETCRQFLSQISILEEAQIAGGFKGVSAMHDITEGGLSTAVEELSVAGRHRIRIDMDKISIYPQTQRICQLLGIDPLGLIGSGSLLICCRKNCCERLMERIRAAGVDAACIGEVLQEGRGIEATQNGESAEWPRYEVDELTRLFHQGTKTLRCIDNTKLLTKRKSVIGFF